MFIDGKILETQVSLGDVLTHLSTIGLLVVYIAKNHKVWNKIKERSDMMWKPFCAEHKLDYTSCEEK